MALRLCVSGCGGFLAPDDGHDHCIACLGVQHVNAVLAGGSCRHCDAMTVAQLRSRLTFARERATPVASCSKKAAGARADLRVSAGDNPPPTGSRTSRSSRRSIQASGGESDPSNQMVALTLADTGDQMSSAASEGGLSLSDEDPDPLAPSGQVSAVKSDPEVDMLAVLSRAASAVGLEMVYPPAPRPDRLDGCYVEDQKAKPSKPLVPFFPEVHCRLTQSWRAPFSARAASASALTALDGGAARGYEAIPSVARAIAVNLCPRGASTWRGLPRLPSKACRLSASLGARAYKAAGQAASALHAMATYQRYQAQALAELHEGGSNPSLLHELRTATDYALRTTKSAACALGRTMSTLVVQERHLWLNLADMRDVDKVRFLDSPISQAGLFGDTVGEFTQEFKAVKEQSDAMGNVIYRRGRKPAPPAEPSTSAVPRRGRPPTSAAPPPPAPPAKRARRSPRKQAAPPAQGAVKSGKRTAKRP
ncbi:uncharacterized protein [Danio rerio]|uniref:Uncharacterized protein n=1 Tax=Danio rerio TaxID=7955 RepID=A0AC58GA69_DANRE